MHFFCTLDFSVHSTAVSAPPSRQRSSPSNRGPCIAINFQAKRKTLGIHPETMGVWGLLGQKAAGNYGLLFAKRLFSCEFYANSPLFSLDLWDKPGVLVIAVKSVGKNRPGALKGCQSLHGVDMCSKIGYRMPVYRKSTRLMSIP